MVRIKNLRKGNIVITKPRVARGVFKITKVKKEGFFPIKAKRIGKTGLGKTEFGFQKGQILKKIK